MKAKDIKEGVRVILPANKTEGWKEERGTVLSDEPDNGTIIVEVDKKYRDKDCDHCVDDGLRETLYRPLKIISR